MDTLGYLTLRNNTTEQLVALKNIKSIDNVHLTEEGYKALDWGWSPKGGQKSISEPMEKGNDKENPSQQTVEWNGFVSHF